MRPAGPSYGSNAPGGSPLSDGDRLSEQAERAFSSHSMTRKAGRVAGALVRWFRHGASLRGILPLLTNAVEPVALGRGQLSRAVSFGQERRDAFLAHVVVASLFFSPFVLLGEVWVGNTDALTLNYPMFYFFKSAFLDGGFGLWNPYVLGGVSNMDYAVSPLFSPDNWLLFLLPERYLFLGITFVTYFKLILVGVFSYLFLLEEVGDARWALFGSIVFQICGHTIWCATAFDAVSVPLFLVMGLYLVWTMQRRGPGRNYLFLVPVVAMMVLSSNTAYGSYAAMIFGALFLYRMAQSDWSGRRWTHLGVFTLACATAVLISSVRFAGLFGELGASQRTPQAPADYRDFSFLLARLFNSEIFGINMHDSFPVFERISDAFRGIHLGWIMPQFFGVIVALAIVWLIFSRKSIKASFWCGFVLVALLGLTFVEPVDYFVRALFFPFYHTLSINVWLPIGVAVLAAFAGRALEDAHRSEPADQEPGRHIAIAVSVIGLFFMLMVGMQYLEAFDRGSPLLLKALPAGLVAILGGTAILARWRPKAAARSGIGLCVGILVVVLGALAAPLSDNATFQYHTKLTLSSVAALLSLLLIVLGADAGRAPRAARAGFVLAAVGLLPVVILAIWPPDLPARQVQNETQTLLTMVLGTLRFLAVGALFFTLLYLLKVRSVRATMIFPVFLLALLVDLVPATKVNAFIIMNPFYQTANVYPDVSPLPGKDGGLVEMDLERYRVNYVNRFMRVPIVEAVFAGEPSTSINVLYRIPSYGGYFNGIPRRYLRFVDNWRPTSPGTATVPANIKDERFLDLVGVRYDLAEKHRIAVVRPNALPRFKLYSHYEIVETDEDALQRLKDPGFDPQKAVLLAENPGFPARGEAGPRAVEVVAQSTDRLRLEVTSEGPAVLLFNDSYNGGWKARVNGEEAPVRYANFNFMSVVVPAGESDVVFSFAPPAFAAGLKLTIAGLAVYGAAAALLILLGWAGLKRWRSRSARA